MPSIVAGRIEQQAQANAAISELQRQGFRRHLWEAIAPPRPALSGRAAGRLRELRWAARSV
jgi:hypothetical protein